MESGPIVFVLAYMAGVELYEDSRTPLLNSIRFTQVNGLYINPLPCEEDVKGKVESSPRVDTDLEIESRYAEVSFVDKLDADNGDGHGL